MDDSMIKHAAAGGFDIAYEEGWVRYKLKHPCTLTCGELLNKFWNEIWPNIHDYECVKEDSTLFNMIKCIPSPQELHRNRDINPVDTPRIHTKMFPAAYEAEAARKKKIALNRVDILEIKNAAITAIANSQNVTERTASTGDLTEGSRESLPGVRISFLPNN